MDIMIYQINMGRDHNRIAFEGLDLLKMYQGSDKIDSRIYDRVFEGEVDCKDLEDVVCQQACGLPVRAGGKRDHA